MVESIDPDGNPVTTSLVQCNECGAVITAAFTDQHDKDHPVVLSNELREQIQRDREHPEQMVARPKRGAAKSE